MKETIVKLIKEDENIVTVPNLLSFARLVFLPFIVYFLSKDTRSGDLYALLFMVLSGLTDFFDGRIARHFHQKSNLGRLIDPLIDKISVATVVIVLAMHKDLPYWYVGVVIGRDLLLLLAGLFVISKQKLVVESNWLGKWTALVLVFVILTFTLDVPVIKWVLFYFTLILIPATLVDYFWTHRTLFHKKFQLNSDNK